MLLAGEPETEQYNQAVEDFLAEERKPAKTRPRKPLAPAGLVTILFTDMEGSTTLTQRLGDAKAQEVLREHNTIVRDALKAHGGSEIKHTGDGVMASFPTASRALVCAIAVQQGFDERNRGVGGGACPAPGRSEQRPYRAYPRTHRPQRGRAGGGG